MNQLFAKAKGHGNASGADKPVKKPRYTRGGSRIGGMLAIIAIVAICSIIDAHLSGIAIASAVGLAGMKYSLLYASPDGSVKSGRAGSVVYMRNGRRRNFVVPSLVQNDFTQTVRNRFGTNSNAWSGLTDAQRATWNNAVGYTYVDRFGTVHVLKGKALYVRLNQNLANAGAPTITDAPLPEEIAGLDSMTLTATSGVLDLAFTPTPTLTNTQLQVFATAPLPAGYSRPSASRYRLIASSSGAVTSPAALHTNYNAKFGVPPVGSKIFVKVILINTVTGQASPANIASAIQA